MCESKLELPSEVWIYIFSFLDFETLHKTLVLVCKDWKALIKDNPTFSTHVILKPPLKDVNSIKPLPWSHFMAKRGDIRSQSPWIGGSLDYQVGPHWMCQHVDHLTKMATSTNATLSDYQLIVKAWKSAKSIELPFIKGIKKIDFAENKNLEKITISGPFPTSTLPNWLKVPKVSFNPSTTKTTEWFGVHNASHLIIIMREHLGMKGANLSEIAKMRNLETLEIIFGGWSDDDPDDTFGRYNGEGEDGERQYWHQLEPILMKLKTCQHLKNLILGLRSYCCYHMGHLVSLIEDNLPYISSIAINDTDETGYSLHSKDGPNLRDLYVVLGFQNLKKLIFSMKLSINLKSRIHEIKHMPSLKNMEPFLERMPKNSVKV